MDNPAQLTEQQLDLLRKQVIPGEFLCWVGSEPRQRYLLHRLSRTGRFVLWSVLAGCLSFFMALMNPGFMHKSFYNTLPVLVPVVLTLLGIYLLLRELYWPGKNGVDLYAITTRRALVISTGRHGRVWAYGSDVVKTLQIVHRKDGSGDIIFENTARWSADAEGRSTRQSQKIGFYGQPAIDEVYARLLHLAHSW